MDSMVVFTVFLVLLFGGGTLALAMSYLNTEMEREEERRRAAQNPVATVVNEIPSFFADLDGWQAAKPTNGRRDELVEHIEGYLRAEQALVDRFIHEPSLDNLYRQAPAASMVH